MINYHTNKALEKWLCRFQERGGVDSIRGWCTKSRL